MANEFGVNINLGGANQFGAVWHTLLRMLKAGAWLRASSDGATKVVSDDPASHTAFPLSNVGGGGAAAHVTAVDDHAYGKLLTITNVSGLVSPSVTGGQSEGNYLTLSGSAGAADDGTHQIYEVLSATSCKVLMRGGSPAVDAGNITWQEKTVVPVAPSYTLGAAQWWACLELMQTLQLSFTSAPIGQFFTGEVVQQAVTNATATVVGYVWNTGASAGWIILQPRSGAWSATDGITGLWSGATVTPAAKHTFRRQIVFWHGSTTLHYSGSCWYQILRDDGGAEIAELYSTKASNGNCTSTVAPGGSTSAGNRQTDPATYNTFYVLRCQVNTTYNGSTAVTHADGIYHANTFGPAGTVNVAVANLMPRSDREADGTWWSIIGNTTYGLPNIIGQFRIDNGEPGDPEVLISLSNGSSSVATRDIAYGGYGGSAGGFYSVWITSASTLGNWRKVSRRAYGSAGGAPFYESPYMSLSGTGRSAHGNVAMGINYGATPRAYCHPAATPPSFREPVRVRDGMSGVLRWMFAAPVGAAYGTAAGKELIAISTLNTASNYSAIYVGPWDQTTDPVI